MPTHLKAPTIIEAAGNKPKCIEEYIGRVNSQTAAVSIAKMTSPSGWVEPGQTPSFDEYTVVLAGMLPVESAGGTIDVHAGEAIITHKGSGFGTARQDRMVRNTLPYACPRFLRIRRIGMHE